MSEDRPSGPPSSAEQGRDPLDLIAEDYLERQRRGEDPRITDYVERNPELSDRLRDILGTLESLAQLRPDTVHPQAPIERLGEYRLLRQLGRGGMGVVYEAEQESLGRRVALKVLAAHALLDPRQRERFFREAQAAASLQHPNIVPVHGIGEHEGIHFYTMQFVAGRGLDEVLDDIRLFLQEPEAARRAGATRSSSVLLSAVSSPGQTTVHEYHRNVARLGLHVAEALGYAHGRGVVHRDIKPSNLLLDAEGKVWITDFGLAKAENGDAAGLTRSDELVGTLRYLAPERLEGRSDSLGDVYSLGLTLYEALTLRPAFDEEDRRKLLKKVAAEEPEAPRRIDSRIPRDLETIILKAIEKEPERRYESASDLAGDLRRFLAGRPLRARRTHALERAWLWCRRNPVVASLAACVLLSLAATAAISTTMVFKMRESLREAYFDRARASRSSRQVGQRVGSLAALAGAAKIRPGRELRDEAIAAMARADLVADREWHRGARLTVRCFDPGLERYAVAHSDGRISIRESHEHSELLEIPGCGMLAYETRFSPDGKYLAASCGKNYRYRFTVWDLETCDLVIDRPSPTVTRLGARFDFSGDSRTLALAWPAGDVAIMEAGSGEVLRRLPFEDRSLDRLALHPEARELAVYFRQRQGSRVAIVDVDTAAVVSEIRSVGTARCLAWQQAGRLLAIADDERITIWDPHATGEPRAVLRGHEEAVTMCEFDPQGDRLVSCGYDQKVRLWDLGSWSEILNLDGRGVRFSEDGRQLVMWTGSRGWIYDVAPRPEFQSFRTGLRRGPDDFDLSADGRWLAAVGQDGLQVWPLGGGHGALRLSGLRAISVRFLAGGRGLVTSGADGLLQVPLDSEGRKLGTPRRLLDRPDLLRMDLDASGVLAVTSNPEQGAFVLDLAAPGPPFFFGPHRKLEKVAVSPGGRWIATFGWIADSVKVWDRRTQACAADLPVPRAYAEFDPRGRWVVTGAADAYRFWSIGDWKEVLAIPREDATGPGPLSFSPDGEHVALGQADRRVHLLRLADAVEVASFEPPDPVKISQIRFGPRGIHLAVSSGKHVLHVWDLKAVRARLAHMGLDW